MNKKTLIVIILAGILAFIGAVSIFNFTREPEKIEPIKEEEVTPLQEPEPVKKETTESGIKNVSYKKTTAQKTAVKELPEIKPIIVKEAELPVHEGFLQEQESKDIVITKEYKVTTPSRYTFK